MTRMEELLLAWEGNTLDDEAMLRAAATPVLVDPDNDLAMRRHFSEARRIAVGTGGR